MVDWVELASCFTSEVKCPIFLDPSTIAQAWSNVEYFATPPRRWHALRSPPLSLLSFQASLDSLQIF